jgi:hypothetical protein
VFWVGYLIAGRLETLKNLRRSTPGDDDPSLDDVDGDVLVS